MAEAGWAAGAGGAVAAPRGRDSPGEQDSGTSGDEVVFECNRYSLDPTETNRSLGLQRGRGQAHQTRRFDLCRTLDPSPTGKRTC